MAARRLLETADRMRVEPETRSALELWRIANELASSTGERVSLFRHACVHAGILARPDGRCDHCRSLLAPARAAA